MARDKDPKRDAHEPEVDENVDVPDSTSEARTDRPKAISGKTMKGRARSASPERPGLV